MITVTGHGLKDTATALEGFTETGGTVVDDVVVPEVAAVAEAAGL